MVMALSYPVGRIQSLDKLCEGRSATTDDCLIQQFPSGEGSVCRCAVNFSEHMVWTGIERKRNIIQIFQIIKIVVDCRRGSEDTIHELLTLQLSLERFFKSLSDLCSLAPTHFLELCHSSISRSGFIFQIFFELLTSSFCADLFFFLEIQLLLNFYILLMDGDNTRQVAIVAKIAVNEFLVVNEDIISGMTVTIAPNNTLISSNHLRESRFTSAVSSKEKVDICWHDSSASIFKGCAVKCNLSDRGFHFLCHDVLLSPPSGLFFVFYSACSDPFIYF